MHSPIKERIVSFVRNNKSNIISVIIALAFVVLFHCLFINAYIPSASMENTLTVKDRIIGCKYDRDYHRGDIVIFHYNEKKYYIKRIIGIENDVVEIKNHEVYVNGKLLHEPYIKEKIEETDYMKYVVPENSYFFLGDNRNDSEDSRFWDDPFRTEDKIIAKAAFRYWPLDKIGIVE